MARILASSFLLLGLIAGCGDDTTSPGGADLSASGDMSILPEDLMSLPNDMRCQGDAACPLVCTAVGDCPATGNECVVATCTSGTCGTMNLDSSHTLATGQTTGDCQKRVCNGQGGVKSADDPTDPPTTTEICLMPTCIGTPLAPRFQPKPADTDCSAEGPSPNHLCGDPTGANAGKCVQCIVQSDCAVPASCSGTVFTPPPTCTAAGSCQAGTPVNCAASQKVCNATLGCVQCNVDADCFDVNDGGVALCLNNMCL
jgi:hypothetical protein